MAKSKKPLELNEELRTELASRVREMIDASNEARADLEERWDQNSAYYNNDPRAIPTLEIAPQVTVINFPLIQPRVDAITDNIVSAIFNVEPHMSARVRGESERNETLENVVQYHWNIGKLVEAVEEVSVLSGITNVGIIRQSFQVSYRDFLPKRVQRGEISKTGSIEYAGLVYDVIHPKDFVIYPAQSSRIQNAACVGHRYTVVKSDLEQMVENGIYYKNLKPFITTSQARREESRTDSFGKTVETVADDEKDGHVEMYEVYVKHKFEGQQQKMYKVVFAYDTDEILRCDEWKFSYTGYFDFRWKAKQYGNFWPSTSVAQDLQGMQWQYSNISNMLVLGGWFSALPAILHNGMFEGTQALQAGAAIGMNGAEATPLNTNFQPGPLFPMLQQIESIADGISGMTKAGIAQTQSARTATQQMSEDAGQANRIGGYIRRYGDALADMASAAQELLYAHFELWYPMHMQNVTIEDKSVLLTNAQWQLTNQNPNQSPMQKIQNLQMLMQLAMTDQEGVIQGVMQEVANIIAQIIPDPQMAEQVFTRLEATVRSLQGKAMNMKEIKRAIINQLNLPNGDKILADDDEATGGAGVLPAPGMAAMPPIATAETGDSD